MTGFQHSFARLWHDDHGFVCSTDLILISTILVIGVIVGLTTLRDQVVQELGDMAVAVGSLNQSYSYSGATLTFGTSTFVVAGSTYVDNSDDCDEADVTGTPPACINICGVAATPE